ncbi:MAG: methylmalonyl-CoA mutase family protein, partial [Thermoplasmata archaeon]|nr:methylmalonyl-CoA mutase family protein [Thermoplasmata archaeon]
MALSKGRSKKSAATVAPGTGPGEYSAALASWEASTLAPAIGKSPERKERFETLGGIPVDRLYTPIDTGEEAAKIGLPGQFPFTRGVHPTMYRGRVWSMRMFSGFGTPEDTNRRFRYLLAHGESGLSIAFDDPTLYGIDADDAEAEGEVGKCGVNVSSLGDMRRLLEEIPLADVTTSMT